MNRFPQFKWALKMGPGLYLLAAVGPGLLSAGLILTHLAHIHFGTPDTGSGNPPKLYSAENNADPGPGKIPDSANPQVPPEALAAGLVIEEGYELIVANCGACHSLKLVTQNRATRNGWADLIQWMQEKHNLWDLGSNRESILNYLATHYGPTDSGRRPPLVTPAWYRLEDPAYDG